MKEVADPTTRGHGTWADSEMEKCLKVLLSCGKQIRAPGVLLQEAKEHIQLFEALKKEFRCLRALWLALSGQVYIPF